MLYKDISQIPYLEELAIVINVGTQYLSTLALLSIKKNTALPVLLIDCPPNDTDGSFVYFKNLLNSIDFNLLQLPLKTHGSTLDYIFKNIKSERILLLDSDAEIVSKSMIDFLLLQSRKVGYFGAGFKHEFRKDIHPNAKSKNQDGLYCERMWLPCTILNVNHIKEAINNKISFNTDLQYSNFKSLEVIARKYYKLKQMKFNFLPQLFGFKFLYFTPNWIFFDTGSRIYQYLKYEKQYDYCGITESSFPDFVNHEFGATRDVLSIESNNREDFEESLIQRINEIYGDLIKK